MPGIDHPANTREEENVIVAVATVAQRLYVTYVVTFGAWHAQVHAQGRVVYSIFSATEHAARAECLAQFPTSVE